ncbi:chaB multi-domain protein [Acidipropionibacterium acidipropionici ATCC 4875]|jgi:cation transport regulator|uniref:ChaB multi-domain protein n=1 Tax=Acidipropionibacterium acidipropionici (strain ATCC 4875 / DSM 20272 / JCM 6432 / NBRC 12425 / NCIMB 8070 / 4) TaxID=1171373 RepID=K7S824_ACIA4|nr:putative cation transport regulator ChaB [Acidipropionibacterium acidipropionici]AFV90742.1 chaB multi-domain protein [Acidipropionibacterium acidipropionici ATCC 4875]ALN15093.1 cation transport regulator [Acidipropionibacterium acidipropionici]APZ09155.1 cation transport regulator [Acidipropionibacterium acidipropionici]
MPYTDTNDLPESVQRVLPMHAQDIYKEAYNSAFDQYKDPSERRGNEDREAAAHKVAWAAVKESYSKGEDGKWHRR